MRGLEGRGKLARLKFLLRLLSDTVLLCSRISWFRLDERIDVYFDTDSLPLIRFSYSLGFRTSELLGIRTRIGLRGQVDSSAIFT